jgi:hypothetical protein
VEAEEKFLLSLEKAKKSLETADHLTYMTFPIVRENRLLLKVLDELYLSIINAINAILQYEYLYKRVQIYQDAKENFRSFQRISSRYNISPEQLAKIIEILTLAEKHKKSPFEFSKNGKIVIMSDNLRTETINIDKIKGFILETKDFLRKCTLIIKRI